MVAISNIQRSNSGRNINYINKTKSYFNISKENNKMKKKPSKWHRRSVSLSDLDKCEIISSLFTKFHELNMEKRQSSEEMDQQRQRTMAYEYLCHLEQVKKWLETCFNETLPPTTELEENLRNGVYLARLANLINPNLVPVKKIYDFNQDKYIKYGLQYRHIDNINYFIKFVESKNLPKNHQPETTDIYDKKNMPRLIYCIYLLSSDMFNSGETTKIENLCGKIQFSDDDIDAVCQEMKKNGIELLLTEFSGLDLTNIKLSDDDGGDGDDNNVNNVVNISSNFQEIININNDNKHDNIETKPDDSIETKLDDNIETKPDDSIETKLDDNIETKPDDIINETFDTSFINALDKIRHNYSANNIYQNDLNKIIKIQAFWRGCLTRKTLKEKKITTNKIIIDNEVQQQIENNKNKNTANDDDDDDEDSLLSQQQKNNTTSIIIEQKNKFIKLKKIKDLFDKTIDKYDKDIYLQEIKTDIIKTIKLNDKLLNKLEIIDIKITQLIKNKIKIDNYNIKKNTGQYKINNKSLFLTYKKNGIKSFTKEGKKIQKSYEYLFYELQTNPDYLAKLIFNLPLIKEYQYLENIIMTLFNFGSNNRDEYYLLKLLERSLEEEINLKYDKPSDLVVNNSIILKMTIDYSIKLNDNCSLKNILGSVLDKFISNNKLINIETNPVNIYNTWINDEEKKFGIKKNIPCSIDQINAMKYDFVRKKLSHGINNLKIIVNEILDKIVSSRNLIPYSILYMAYKLKNILNYKFPNVPDKHIYIIIGNYLYYHFLNAAIVSPDAFNIIPLSNDHLIATNQRKNLANVAKILQFAATKKNFGDEAPHLMCLNSFINNCHDKFKKFFQSCCQVETLEKHFEINEFTEVTQIHKPQIFITLNDICNTHTLLLKYQYDIAPNKNDKIHELLNDINIELPISICSLVGLTDKSCCINTINKMAREEINLNLTNKYYQVKYQQKKQDYDNDIEKLFIITKELLVTIIHYFNDKSFNDALEIIFSTDQTSLSLSSTLLSSSSSLSSYSLLSPSSYLLSMSKASINSTSSSANEYVLRLKTYLHSLEQVGRVTRNDGYQDIINNILIDYENNEKSMITTDTEIEKLTGFLNKLKEKKNYYNQQVKLYSEYFDKCLINLYKRNMKKLKTTRYIKYTGEKLVEKGIILDIVGASYEEWKNITFELSQSNDVGVFILKGLIEIDQVYIDLQDLLEMQYEGLSFTTINKLIKININLMLDLINHKFYSKPL